MHVYVWEHIASLYYRTALWMFTKLGRDEVLIAWHMHKDQGRGQIGQGLGGGLPFAKRLLQTGMLQQQTEFIAMI